MTCIVYCDVHAPVEQTKPVCCLLPYTLPGIDSRAGMELRQSLSTSIGITLPPTLLYDYQVQNLPAQQSTSLLPPFSLLILLSLESNPTCC